MAGFGPPPADTKRHRIPDPFGESKVTVAADEVPDAAGLPDADSYSELTQHWYATWCQAPQAAVFTVTDWQRLHMLAPLVDAYFEKPSTKLLAEIRINESLLGATHVDRMRARIKVEQPKRESVEAGEVADLRAARRRRMSDAS